jgi:ABC-type bacteriocin/lantibiotic exporter with double-glycine peptidase domain
MLLFLIEVLSDSTMAYWLAWMYAALLVFCMFLSAFLRSHSLYQMAIASIMIRNQLMSAVYSKATRLSSKALSQTDSGAIINMMSTDANRINQVGRWLMLGFVGPIELVGVFVFLGIIVGWYALIALIILIISLPINGLVAKWYFHTRVVMNPLTDSRLKLVGEFVKYVRAIKYYAWEQFFSERLHDLRAKEMDVCWSLNQSRSVLLQGLRFFNSIVVLVFLNSIVFCVCVCVCVCVRSIIRCRWS